VGVLFHVGRAWRMGGLEGGLEGGLGCWVVVVGIHVGLLEVALS